MKLSRYCLITILISLLLGCATQPLPVLELPAKPVSITLEQASSHSNEALNVSILLFDTGDSSKIGRIYQPIRNAEAAYLPVLLKNTLVESGFWGAVSVVPSLDTASELFVTGQIIESNAVELSIRFVVKDSRGVLWLDQVYRDFAEPSAYELDANLSEDPFQDLFDQLANDMSKIQTQLVNSEVELLLDTAMLRYAVLLSPEAFSSYLAEDEMGVLKLEGLPARNDPLYQRVRDIRDREFSIQDVVDEHFKNFHFDMSRVYPYWRQSSFELLAYNQQISQTSNGRGRGEWSDVERVYRLYKERKLNEDELRELADSFEREIEPTVAELEGRVIELQGSLLTQYQTWRKILQKIYLEKVGQTPVIQTAP